MTLPYLGCFTRSSTSTTTVLSILSLVTRPSRALWYPRLGAASVAAPGFSLIGVRLLVTGGPGVHGICGLRSAAARRRGRGRPAVRLRLLGDLHHDAELTLPHHRVDAGDLLADGAQPPVVLQLAGGTLEAQVEQLFLGLGQLAAELVLGVRPQLVGGQARCHHASPISRFTTRHFIG